MKRFDLQIDSTGPCFAYSQIQFSLTSSLSFLSLATHTEICTAHWQWVRLIVLNFETYYGPLASSITTKNFPLGHWNRVTQMDIPRIPD